MLRTRRILGLLCAPLGACLLLALTPAGAMADTMISGTPTVDGAPFQVGQTLTCDTSGITVSDGVANDGTPQITDYTWHQDSSSGAVVADGIGFTQYNAAVGDLGHPLVCVVTASDGFTPDGTATSPVSPVIMPVASVTLTQYSPAVSGKIGEDVSGVTVHLTLKRVDQNNNLQTVATRSIAANASDGSWSTTLTPSVGSEADAFGAPGDELDVSYTGSGVTLPPSGTYTNGNNTFPGDNATISADGTTVALEAGNCIGVNAIVDGTPNPMSFNVTNSDCELTGQSLTDNSHVQASIPSVITANDGTTSNLTTISDIGLLDVGTGRDFGTGAPTCTADLVSGLVQCVGLSNLGTFFVSNGGTPVQLSLSNTGGAAGFVEYTGTASLSGLAAGQQITLTQSSVSRTLATLHIDPLQVQIASSGDVTGGSCQPNKALSPGDLGNQALCSTGGAIPPDVFFNVAPSEFDDLGGGSTLVSVPATSNVVPSSEDSLPDSGFVAYADLFGTGSTAQVLSQIATVNLQIIPHGGGAAVFNQNMTLTSDGTGPFADVTVPALSPGRYVANWTLTDSHGDVSQTSAVFAVQAEGATGPQGSPGQNGAVGPKGDTGPQGPQGPAGQSSKCTVTTKGKGKHKKQHITCTLISHSVRFVSIEITRGKRTYAVGNAVVHSRRSAVELRSLRTIQRGRYVVTIVESKGKQAIVVRYRTRL